MGTEQLIYIIAWPSRIAHILYKVALTYLITAERFSLLVGIGGSHEPKPAEPAGHAGVDATTSSCSVKSLERSDLVRSRGERGRAGEHLVLTNEDRRLVVEAMIIWERARIKLAGALGRETSCVAGRVMSRLAVAAQVGTLAADFGVARDPPERWELSASHHASPVSEASDCDTYLSASFQALRSLLATMASHRCYLNKRPI